MKKITGVFLNADEGTIQEKTIEKSLDGYYDLLKCDTIDIVSRSIGGQYYDIVCDDEGLLNDSPIVSAIGIDGTPMLVGNLFIVKFDGVDNERSIFGDEITHVFKNTCVVFNGDHVGVALTSVGY